jgi:hypothetical protein
MIAPESMRRHAAASSSMSALGMTRRPTGHDRVGGDDVGAAQFLVDPDAGKRHLRLLARQPVGERARQLALHRNLVDSAGCSESGSIRPD